MQTEFQGWEKLGEDLEKIFDQHEKKNMIDIPNDADLAEYFKTAKSQVVYRAVANKNITNTCVSNTAYSFYLLLGTFILGFSHDGSEIYQANFVNKRFGGWQKVLTDAIEEIELPMLEGYILARGFITKNSANEVTINALVYKDGAYFDKNLFTPIATMPVQWRPRMEIFGQGNFQEGSNATINHIIHTSCVSISGNGTIHVNPDIENMGRVSFNLSYKAV